LFGNPVTWAVYNKMLPQELIDWRHHGVISCEVDRFLKPKKNLKYLAVGSSQTSVLFDKYAKQCEELSVFALAGLSPLDFYTYRKEIVRRKPKYVLMNLSEFDIARNPELASSKWSPYSFRDIVELRSVIDTSDYFTPEEKQLISDLFFSKYFPEYKYSFVFKDLLDIPFNKNRLLHNALVNRVNDSVSLAVHLKYLSGLSEKYISFNMHYLVKAIEYLNENNIKTIIVEGQYNPLAYQPHNLILNKQVNALLSDFTLQNRDNVFLSRNEIPNFVKDDYRDGYHVNENAGFTYADSLIKELDSKLLFPEQGNNLP
jgi:hypothetical protein